MKKFNFDKKYLAITFLALLVICISIIFEKTMGNAIIVFTRIGNFIGHVLTLMSPFIYAFCFAYLLNPLVKNGGKQFS